MDTKNINFVETTTTTTTTAEEEEEEEVMVNIMGGKLQQRQHPKPRVDGDDEHDEHDCRKIQDTAQNEFIKNQLDDDVTASVFASASTSTWCRNEDFHVVSLLHGRAVVINQTTNSSFSCCMLLAALDYDDDEVIVVSTKPKILETKQDTMNTMNKLACMSLVMNT